MRGDHRVNDIKLGTALGAPFRPAQASEFEDRIGPAGYIGPVGTAVPILMDRALSGDSYISGANRPDTHLRGVRPGRDFAYETVDVRSVVAGDTVLATNTSSIGLAALADALRDPARFLGLHFFNPVPASRLVEIVVGDATAAGVVERARGWVETLGKTPIVVADAPGFASSRLGLALALEAIRMVEAGVASPADIDAAMELGYRHPAGPLRTTDIVGLDVRLAIAEELHATLGDRFAPPDLLRRMVADGHLGRKTGRGFYEWSSP